MGCQYEYVFAGDTDYHGFLPHHPGQWADPVVEKGVRNFELRNYQVHSLTPLIRTND